MTPDRLASILARLRSDAPSPETAHIGPYRLLEPLGRGGMASVFRAEREGDQGFRKEVALKRMHPHLDEKLEARFAAEARTNARLVHANLVQVLDYGTLPERYLVMELVSGITLAQLLARASERGRRLPIPHVLAILSQCAAALDYVHRRTDDAGQPLGIVHRDVSPQNVLLSWEGEVKVSDFGLAKSADHDMMTTIGARLGKIAYMAPEQLDGIWVDARTDIWALGVVAWECLTQERMLSRDLVEAALTIKQGVFARPSDLRAEVPLEIDALVMHALTASADARLDRASTFARVTRRALHEMAPGFGPEDLATLLGELFPEH